MMKDRHCERNKAIQVFRSLDRHATVAMTIILLLGSVAHGEDIEESMRVPKQMQGAEIVDKRGAKIDTNLVFTRQDGARVPLSTYFNESEKLPAIVTIGYFECPMLCNLVLKGLLDTLNKMSLVLGKDYRILSFSIDPREKSDLAAAKRTTHLKALNLSDGAWDFLTGDEKEIQTLAATFGFGYKYDAPTDQYAHGAAIFIVEPKGVLSNTIWGIAYDRWSTTAALIDASHGKSGSVFDKIVMTCFHYDADSHKYGFYIFGAMRLAGALTVLVFGSMLAWYWFSERRRRMGLA